MKTRPDTLLIVRRSQTAFTMIEIAICLAIIGVALVGIIGVLPYGMNSQRDTRQETIIGQDANLLTELIRNGARGDDDLTNYVYEISNTVTTFDNNGNVVQTDYFDYKTTNSTQNGGQLPHSYDINTGARIIGYLSTPEYYNTLPQLGVRPVLGSQFGGISNHVVALVHSISGLATEKPPQDNSLMLGDAFTYKVLVVNAPVALDTNLFQPLWQAQSYSAGSQVFYNWSFWMATNSALDVDTPGLATVWQRIPSYPLALACNQHDLRLRFLWPLRPSGAVGAGDATFRTSISGDLKVDPLYNLFYYQPQTTTLVQ